MSGRHLIAYVAYAPLGPSSFTIVKERHATQMQGLTRNPLADLHWMYLEISLS